MNIVHAINSLKNYIIKLFFLCFSVVNFAAQPKKQILAIFREWSSTSSSSSISANESSKMATDRVTREKIKKIKNLLAENVPNEHLVTLQ